MRTVFMGADSFSVPSLERLAEISDLAAVVTQPDRPKGRGLRQAANPVKEAGARLGVQVLTPAKLKDESFLHDLRVAGPEAIFVAAYAKLVPPVVLDLPRWGCVNIHPSLLPRHRGPTPVETAILEGDTVTGVTTFFMDRGYDTGDIILQETYPIEPGDTGGVLREKLARAGADLIEKTYRLIEKGEPPRVPQERAAGNYTRLFTRDDSFIDWRESGQAIVNRIRAFFPQPGTFALFRGKSVKITHARYVPERLGAPGTIIEIVRYQGILVGAGAGAVLLEEVQPEGKRIMSGWDFAQGHRPAPDEILLRA
jgi:methionyl-tRNA formyltransferase